MIIFFVKLKVTYRNATFSEALNVKPNPILNPFLSYAFTYCTCAQFWLHVL